MKKTFLSFSRYILPLAAAGFIAACSTHAPSDLSEEQFADPSIEYRPMALWDWINGYVDRDKAVYELEQMKSQGMQGALIWDLGSLSDPKKMIPEGPAFLGEESLNTISLVIENASRLGLNMGLMTASSWNAGGSWIQEEDASMALLSSVQTLTGPGKKTMDLPLPENKRKRKNPATYRKWITTLAVPHTADKSIDYSGTAPAVLDSFVKDGRLVDWNAPEGKWDIVSFYMCATGQPLACPSPNSKGYMIDHLSKKATEFHFNTILSRLESISTPEKRLKYLDLDSYEVWPARDWSPAFIQEFKNRTGYDPVPYLPLLQGYESTDKILAERFRGDYGRVVSDMMIEYHFEQGTRMANAKGMELIAEAGHGGYPRVDPLKAMGHTDIPMGEFWNGKQFWVTKEASSAAHIYGKKIVASESLTGWQDWQDGPGDYKQLFDVAFCEGLNQGVFHTFAHNPEIAGKPGFVYHAGEHLNVNTTWWEMSRPFMDYLSRCSYMLRQGNFVADFCMYYGDQCPNLVPPKRIDPNMVPPHDKGECQHCGQPLPVDPGPVPGHDYDYMNEEIICTAMKVQDGNLVLPSGISYRFMLLPDRKDISLNVLRSLEKLVADGAVILGPRPERSTSLKDYPQCDKEIQTLADRIWGKCDGKTVRSNTYGKGMVYWGLSVSELLARMDIRPDFEVKGTDNSDMHIDYIHHRTASEDIYFISNSSTESQKINCTFRVDKGLVPEIWDAETGLIQRETVYKATADGIRMDFIMDPIASRFIVFRPETSGKNDPELKYDLQFGFGTPSLQLKNRINLSSNWKVSFDPQYGGPASCQAATLTDWAGNEDEGIRYFSGKAVYTKNFGIKEGVMDKGTEAFLTFQDIQETARVLINGKECGILWTPPYQLNVTRFLKDGDNTVTVEVINTWNNRIVGDVLHPDGRQYTNTNIKHKFRNKGLLKSGLTGQVLLNIVENR